MNSLLGPKIGTLLYTLTLTLNPVSQKMLNNILKTDCVCYELLAGPQNQYTALYTNPNPKPHLSKDVKLIFQKRIEYVMNSLLGSTIGTLLYTLTLTLCPISQKMLN